MIIFPVIIQTIYFFCTKVETANKPNIKTYVKFESEEGKVLTALTECVYLDIKLISKKTIDNYPEWVFEISDRAKSLIVQMSFDIYSKIYSHKHAEIRILDMLNH